jgi:hypothetical protein
MVILSRKGKILITKNKFSFNDYPTGKHLLVERKESSYFFWEKKIISREFKLGKNFACSFSFKGFTYKITIKKGFIYDGASIPKFAWSLIGSPFTGLYLEAATVHDAIYYSSWEHGRKLADEVFLFIMLQVGVPSITAKTMFNAVRLGGSSSFNKRKDIDLSEFLTVERVNELSDRLNYGQNEKRPGGKNG